MIVQAHAKINIALNVVGLRKDGYHDLDMVVVPLELHDSIEITLLPSIYDTYITCDDYSIPIDEYNLVSIAVRKMREFYGFKEQFRIHIHKNIPSSAGLGGGSSDAAAVIKGIVALLKIPAKEADLFDIALSIGADVPFFLINKPARVRGVGEIVDPITVKEKYHVLLVKPFAGCSTKEVFSRFIEGDSGKSSIEKVIEALGKDQLNEVTAQRANDLEAPAITLLEDIEMIMAFLREDGFPVVGMSGSGSCVFAMGLDHHHLSKAYKKYSKKGYYVELSSIIR